MRTNKMQSITTSLPRNKLPWNPPAHFYTRSERHERVQAAPCSYASNSQAVCVRECTIYICVCVSVWKNINWGNGKKRWLQKNSIFSKNQTRQHEQPVDRSSSSCSHSKKHKAGMKRRNRHINTFFRYNCCNMSNRSIAAALFQLRHFVGRMLACNKFKQK